MAQTKLGILIETLYKGKGAKDATRDLKGLDKEAGKSTSTLDKVQGSLGKVALAAGTVGAALYTAKKAFDFGKEGAQIAKVGDTFDLLTQSIGETSAAVLNDLRAATEGMVTDTELMAATSRNLSMGLAETGDEAAKLAEIAVTLGGAMGKDAGAAMEEFALLLSNQSIPRLDTFGISAGKVKNRIKELRDANEDMTRETAFMTATMEEADIAMARLGDAVPVDDFTLFDVQVKNLTDDLKVMTSEALGPTVGGLNGLFTVRDLRKEFESFGVSAWDFQKMLQTSNEETTFYTQKIDAMRVAAGLLEAGFEGTTRELVKFAVAQRAADARAQAMNEHFSQFAAAADEATAATEELTGVSAKYFDGTKEGILSQEILNQDIVDAAIAAGGTAQQIAILGGAMGLYSDEAVEAAIQTAVVMAAVDELAQQYVDGAITADQMRGEVYKLRQELENTQGDYQAKFDIKVTGLSRLQEAKRLLGGGTSFDVPLQDQPRDPTGSQTWAPPPVPTPSPFGGGAQHGANFIVPPGFPNDTFPLRVTSGEHVQVTPAGGTNNNQTVNIYTGADEAAIMRALQKAGIQANARRRTM